MNNAALHERIELLEIALLAAVLKMENKIMVDLSRINAAVDALEAKTTELVNVANALLVLAKGSNADQPAVDALTVRLEAVTAAEAAAVVADAPPTP